MEKYVEENKSTIVLLVSIQNVIYSTHKYRYGHSPFTFTFP